MARFPRIHEALAAYHAAREAAVVADQQEPGVEYEYRVVAVNKAGEGRPSNTVRAVL